MAGTPIKLCWRGSIGVGNLPDQHNQECLKKPHVYLYAQNYSAVTVVYAGQSRNFLNRLWEHNRNMLGLHSWIRDSDGLCLYNPSRDYMLERLNNISDFYPDVVADTARMRFFYAHCCVENLDAVESRLIAHLLQEFKCPTEYPDTLEALVSEAMPGKHGDIRYLCDNGRQQSDSGIQVSLAHNFQRVASEERKLLEGCLPSR